MIDDPELPVIIRHHPAPEEYLEAETRFFYTLGNCVNRWAYVDRQLYRLYRFGLKTDSMRSAILYYKQKTLSQRIQYVDSLLEYSLTEEQFRNEWRPLRNRLQNDLLPTRNIFVHHPARRTGTVKDGKPFYFYSIHIEPYERTLNKQFPGLKGKECLDIGDLERHALDVETLENDLREFVRKLVRASQQATHSKR